MPRGWCEGRRSPMNLPRGRGRRRGICDGYSLCGGRAGEESLSAEDLGVSRQQLKHFRDAGKLVALRRPMHREFVYPAWQFDSETGQQLDGVSEIVAASAEVRLSPRGLHLLMVSTAGADGTSPADWLAAGRRDYVIGLVAASNAHGS